MEDRHPDAVQQELQSLVRIKGATLCELMGVEPAFREYLVRKENEELRARVARMDRMIQTKLAEGQDPEGV